MCVEERTTRAKFSLINKKRYIFLKKRQRTPASSSLLPRTAAGVIGGVKSSSRRTSMTVLTPQRVENLQIHKAVSFFFAKVEKKERERERERESRK